MNNYSKYLINNGLTFGLILGAISIVLDLLQYILGSTGIVVKIIIGLISLALIISIFVISNKTLCKKQGGHLNYWEGVLNLLIVGFISSIMISIYYYCFIKFFDSTVMTKELEDAIELYENNNFPQETIDKAYDARDTMTPIKYFLQKIGGLLIFSIIVSLITAAFTRKKNDAFSDYSNIEEKSE